MNDERFSECVTLKFWFLFVENINLLESPGMRIPDIRQTSSRPPSSPATSMTMKTKKWFRSTLTRHRFTFRNIFAQSQSPAEEHYTHFHLDHNRSFSPFSSFLPWDLNPNLSPVSGLAHTNKSNVARCNGTVFSLIVCLEFVLIKCPILYQDKFY